MGFWHFLQLLIMFSYDTSIHFHTLLILLERARDHEYAIFMNTACYITPIAWNIKSLRAYRWFRSVSINISFSYFQFSHDRPPQGFRILQYIVAVSYKMTILYGVRENALNKIHKHSCINMISCVRRYKAQTVLIWFWRTRVTIIMIIIVIIIIITRGGQRRYTRVFFFTY